MLILPISAIAQSTYEKSNEESVFSVWAKKQLHFGVKIGTNAVVPSDNVKATKFLPGITAGVFLDISINSWLGWHATAQYNNRLWESAQQNTTIQPDGSSITNIVNLFNNQKYIEVPMGFYCNLTNDFRIDLGAQIQKLIDAKADAEHIMQAYRTNPDGSTILAEEKVQKLAFDYLKDANGTGAYADNSATFTTPKINDQNFYKDLNFAAKIGISTRFGKHIRIEAHTLYDLGNMINEAYAKQNTTSAIGLNRTKAQQLNVQLGLSYQF